MHQGNWKCSGCGGAITELPFQPRSESGLTCRTCYAKQKDKEAPQAPEANDSIATEAPEIPDDAMPADGPAPSAPDFEDAAPATAGEKPKFEGSWTCSGCSGPITSLPFQPRETGNLKCLDCFKKSRG